MLNFQFILNTGELKTNVSAVPAKVDKLVMAVMHRQAGVSEGEMRSQAPWRDQTGNARSGLHAVNVDATNEHGLILAHGVPYGIWLEVRWGGKYAIIYRSVVNAGQSVMGLLQAGLNRL